MDCYYHPGRESTKACDICGKPLCDECAIELAGKTYCKDCLENIVGGNATAPQETEVKQQSISETIQEMDSPFDNQMNDYFEEPQPVSFKTELPNREDILEDVLGNEDPNKSKYSQYDIRSPLDDSQSHDVGNYNDPMANNNNPYDANLQMEEPPFTSQGNYNEPQYTPINDPMANNNNPYDINPKAEESYYAPQGQNYNPYQENVNQNSFDDGFIYPDHTYEPPELQGYNATEAKYDSYLNDLYGDDPNVPLSQQLAKDEENYGSLTKTPYERVETRETIYEQQYVPNGQYPNYEDQGYQSGYDPYVPQGDMQQKSFLDINNVTHNNPQGDYIPQRQPYSAYDNNQYGGDQQRPGAPQNDSGMIPGTRPIHSIPKIKEPEPVGAVDIVLTIILIILIIVVLFYVIFIFLLSSYYPTFTDAIYGLTDPGTFFNHLMGK